MNTYVMDITLANEVGEEVPPEWFLEYSLPDDYDMDSLLPKAFDDLARRLVDDDALFDQFYR